MTFEERVRDYIAQRRLLQPGVPCLVALSGGADSVALLRVLLSLGYPVEAAHCNFRLRGAESDRDEQFVRQLCQQHAVKLHVAHFDTTFYAQLHHVSIEMAARQLRYNYFDQLLRDTAAQSVCVAHHQDDAAETLLINLLRGTGIHGLTGIRPRRGNVVRPLLGVSRADITAYLSRLHQPFVTDSTNLTPSVLRNKVRLQLLPLMESLVPSARAALLTTARHMAEAEQVLDHTLAQWQQSLVRHDASGQSVSIAAVQRLASPATFLHHWLSPLGFTSAQTSHIASALPGQTGSQYHSATHALLFDRHQLRVLPLDQLREQPPLTIPEPGLYRLPGGDGVSTLSVEQRPGAHILRQPAAVGLDAALVHFPLCLRPVRTGDRFQPFGMSGSQLVSDYLTNRKHSLFDKRRQLVVTDATGAILWLVRQRTADPFRVSPQTQNTLVLTVG